MAHLTGAEARELGRKLVLKHPEGISVAAIVAEIQKRHPDAADGTIRGATWKLEQDFPNEIRKLPDGKRAPKKASVAKPKNATPLTDTDITIGETYMVRMSHTSETITVEVVGVMSEKRPGVARIYRVRNTATGRTLRHGYSAGGMYRA